MKLFKILFTVLSVLLVMVGVIQAITGHGPWLLLFAVAYAVITLTAWLPAMIGVSVLHFAAALATIAGGYITEGFVLLGIALMYAIFTLLRGLRLRKAATSN